MQENWADGALELDHFRRVPVSSIGLTALHRRGLHVGPARLLSRMRQQGSPDNRDRPDRRAPCLRGVLRLYRQEANRGRTSQHSKSAETQGARGRVEQAGGLVMELRAREKDGRRIDILNRRNERVS